MLTATAYTTHAEQLFDRIRQFHSMLTAAGIPCRIVGGMAVFIHVFERDPLRARLTSDIDVAIDRPHLPSVIEAARKVGWVYRHMGGVDILMDATEPIARCAVHLRFLNEKVRPNWCGTRQPGDRRAVAQAAAGPPCGNSGE
jgi:hypothetical protein